MFYLIRRRDKMFNVYIAIILPGVNAMNHSYCTYVPDNLSLKYFAFFPQNVFFFFYDSQCKQN